MAPHKCERETPCKQLMRDHPVQEAFRGQVQNSGYGTGCTCKSPIRIEETEEGAEKT